MSTAEAIQQYTLTVERHFDAPVERVFDAWLSKEALEQWFSPSPDMAVRVEQIDPHSGGSYKIYMDDPDCDAHIVSGEYVSIDRPNQLVFTWAWETDPDDVSLVTVSLSAEGDGTVLSLLHEKLPSQGSRDEHEKGWGACIERLVTLVDV